MAGTTCDCGHEMFDGRGCCPGCMERQQKRHYRLSGRSSGHSPTPPPTSQPIATRESLDRGRPSSTHTSGSRFVSPATAAINSAFASGDEHIHSHEHVDVLPPHLYRTPRRASSRISAVSGASSSPPMRSATIRHSDDHIGPIVGQLARPRTPTSNLGAGGSVTREYSPMAAGFASITRRQGKAEPLVDERRFSQRESLELAVRMFDGPA